MGYSRGGLVGQVDQDTVGQAEVQNAAHTADLVGEGLGKEALQLPHSLLDHVVDPLGDSVPRNEKLLRFRAAQKSEGWSACVCLRRWGYLRLSSLGGMLGASLPRTADRQPRCHIAGLQPPGGKKENSCRGRVSERDPRGLQGGRGQPLVRHPDLECLEDGRATGDT